MRNLPDLTAQYELNAEARGMTHLMQIIAATGDKSVSTYDTLTARLGTHSAFAQRFQKATVAGIAGTANLAHLEAELARGFLDRRANRGLRGQIPWVPLPPNTFAPVATSTAVASYVAGGAPIPVVRLDLNTVYVGASQIAIIAVLLDTLVKSASERVITLLERLLSRIVMDAEDEELLSATAAIAGQRPAGLLFGKSPLAAGSPGSLATDIELLFAETRGGAPNAPWFVVSPRGALFLSLLRGEDGPMFPSIGVNGGSLGGVPVAVSKAAGSKLILLDADAVGLFDGGMLIDRSISTALQMNDAPSNGPQSATSMFQTNAVALKLTRILDFVAGYADAVNFITLPTIAGSPS
jgi:hypothetical protein